jgi:hypothetical protein
VANDLGRVVRRVDMGWPQWKVGVEYDGEQHFTNAVDYENDIVRVSSRRLRYERPSIVPRATKALTDARR